MNPASRRKFLSRSRLFAALVAPLALTPLSLKAEYIPNKHLIFDYVVGKADPNFAGYLFYSNRPSSRTEVVRHTDEGRLVYDVTYTIDALRRRVNPLNPKNTADRQLLFLGCSVTFGEGLMDDQTIPAQIVSLTHKTQSFNYGTIGYGPGHVLSYLRYFDLAKEYPDPSKVSLVYIWGDYLLDRVSGSLLHLSWGGNTPYYSPESGQLEFHGRMGNYFPVKSFLARTLFGFPLLGDRLMKYETGLKVEQYETQAEVDLSLLILQAAFAEYRRQFKNDSFYVVFYPFSHFSRDKMKAPLEKMGIKVIDLTELFPDDSIPTMLIKDDGHPSVAGAHLIAEKLVKALALE